MSDNKKVVTHLTDETINSVVQYVEAAEVMGKTLGMSVSRAVYVMLKSAQVMQKFHAKGAASSLEAMANTTRVQ